MKISESPAVAVETVIKADPERVYELMSDISVMAGFGTEFVAGEWATGRPGTVGSTFRGRQRLGDAEWETISTITAATKGREFAWVVGAPDDATASWSINLRKVPDGTEVKYSFVHGPGPSGLRERIEARPEDETKLIEGRLETLQQNMIRTLEGVRTRTAR